MLSTHDRGKGGVCIPDGGLCGAEAVRGARLGSAGSRTGCRELNSESRPCRGPLSAVPVSEEGRVVLCAERQTEWGWGSQ